MLKLLILLGIILLVSLLFEYCILYICRAKLTKRINKPKNINDNKYLPARRTHVKYKPLRAVLNLHHTTWLQMEPPVDIFAFTSHH